MNHEIREMEMRKMKLFFDHPAKGWHESLLLGNGRLGAAVFGGTGREEIALNEDTLWSGYPKDTQKAMLEGYLEKIRDLTRKKEYKKAMEFAEESLGESEDVQMYVPFGNLFLEVEGEEEITDYKRELNFDTAEVVITYQNHGAKVERRCFISEPDQVMVYHMVSEEPFSLRIFTEGGYLTGNCWDDGFLKAFGRCPGRNPFTVGEGGSEKAVPVFPDDPKEQGMRYEGWGKVVSTEGEVRAENGALLVQNTREITLYYGIRSSFAGFDRHPVLNGQDPEPILRKDLACAKNSYETLRERHLKEYQPYYQRVSFSLGDDPFEEKDLKKRLIDFQENQEDLGLSALLFQYGRYLLIASSRPKTQAANLQGIWNAELIPPWFSDYTININTEMNYWPAGPCNLDEMMEPLVTLCKEMQKDGEKTAKAYFGVEGAASFHNVDIWRKTSPADGRAMWNFWPVGYAWLCRNLYDQYLFTEDMAYLKEIYPVLKENVRFAVEAVTRTEKGYVLSPATSPENTFLFDGVETSVAEYSENANAIIRNLLRDFLEASRILDVTEELVKRAEKVLAKMAVTQVGTQGQILEWNEELEEADVHHRHLSHLYELHPGRGIQENTPKLFEAARKSLLRRGDEGTGWSLAWKILMWARMKDGAHVGQIVNNLLRLVDPESPTTFRGGGVYPNLLCAHPPYQIDGNFGYTAGVAELLLQSHGGEIHILPALPPRWTKGRVTGLKARGDITVDISWEDGKVETRLVSSRTKTMPVRIAWEPVKAMALEAGKPAMLTGRLG